MRHGTIVYVHGASDRRAQVEDHVARIEAQLARAGMLFDVLPSRWGEALGADLSRIEDALPTQPVPAARIELAEPQGEPLAELSRLAGASAPAARLAAAAPAHRQTDELIDICRAQVGQPGEAIVMRDGTAIGLAAACRQAADSVATSSEYALARASAAPEAQLIDVVGRAIASTAAAAAAAPQEVARTVELRIAEAVLGSAIATLLAGYLGIDVGPDLKRWATDVLVPHRARLVRDAGLGPADVVLYQRSGGEIRRFVLATIAEAIAAGGPVVALGNSMGGIVLVDALAAPDGPRPDLLVTVGSQAPLLATFGALAPLGQPAGPPPFQPWLNVYDRRDLLGFVAGRVWPDQPAITDHEVDLGVGFPDAHGVTYLSHPGLYAAIRGHPALADGGGAPPRRRFDVRSGSLSAPLRLLLGARPETAFVAIDDRLHARLGRFELRVPWPDVEGARIAPAARGRSALGFLAALLTGVAALGWDGEAGVVITLRRAARWWIFGVRALEIAVDDPVGLAAALALRAETASAVGYSSSGSNGSQKTGG